MQTTRITRTSAISLLLIATAIGCQKSPSLDDGEAKAQPPSKSSSSRSSRPVAVPVAKVTVEEAEAFARELEESFVNNDAVSFNRLIDWTAMAESAASGLGLPKNLRDATVQGLVTSMNGKDSLVPVMRRTGGPEATYQLLRVRDEGGRKHVLMRMLGATGVNYHDLTLAKKGDAVRATKLFVYLTGESISETWHRLLLPMAKEQTKNWMQKLATKESEYVTHATEIGELNRQVLAGEYEGALRTYQSLPSALQKDKTILLLRFNAAANVSNEEHMQAAQDFRDAHPDAACLDMLMIDGHFLRKEFDEAIACIDRIDMALGGDGYTKFLKGSMLMEQGKNDEAKAMMLTGVIEAPDLIECRWGLVSASLHAKDFELTLEALRKMDEDFEMEWEDINDIAEFAEFAKSPQGKEWRAEKGF